MINRYNHNSIFAFRPTGEEGAWDQWGQLSEILEISFYNKVLENLIIITSIENHKKNCNQRL